LTPYETSFEYSATFCELDRLPVPLRHLRENLKDLLKNKTSWNKSCH